ncbi:MAG: phenylalanine--tRNA ligase subunit alpha, partial [Candidatus Micrarchaeota archaeon]|nr:phenylalanine--tRNA ligase subunit alpha [Candidatus Micrarchaeota archaeon]
ENIDYKHLTDFYQSDGIIIGESLTMANLFDTLTRIYAALGIKVRFKPAYFPFVEPGAEVYAYHEQRKEWLEIAGCGILRREITGVSRKNVTVLAWGSSVERLLMIKDPEIERISDLYNNGVGWLRSKKLV